MHFAWFLSTIALVLVELRSEDNPPSPPKKKRNSDSLLTRDPNIEVKV